LTTDVLADNSCSIVDVRIMGKRTGNFDDWVSAKLTATYGRNTGGPAINVPTEENAVKNTTGLAGTTARFAASGDAVQILVTPGASVTIDWGIVVTVSEGKA
jgi:hypothetical protein